MTGLHPRDLSCQQASAGVSLSKTLTPQQLQAAGPQPGLTSDLTLPEKVGVPVEDFSFFITALLSAITAHWVIFPCITYKSSNLENKLRILQLKQLQVSPALVKSRSETVL